MVWYKVVCRASGLLLDRKSDEPPYDPVYHVGVCHNGNTIQLWGGAGDGQRNQHWGIVPVEADWVKIVARQDPSYALDADLATAGQEGCTVQLWSHPGSAPVNVQWRREADGHLTNRHSGLVLNANLPDVRTNGCRVQLWSRTSGPNEYWDFVQVAVD